MVSVRSLCLPNRYYMIILFLMGMTATFGLNLYYRVITVSSHPTAINILYLSAMLITTVLMIVYGSATLFLFGCVFTKFIGFGKKSFNAMSIGSSHLQECKTALNTYYSLKKALSLPLLLFFSSSTLSAINCIYFTIIEGTLRTLFYLSITVNICIIPVYLALLADDCFLHLQELYRKAW